MDPVDWAAWLYGKFGHGPVAVLAIVALGLIAIVWARGVDRYKETHPAAPSAQHGAVASAPKKSIEETLTADGKNAAAVALGRKGGLARARKMSKADRAKIARAGARALWKKKKAGSK